MSPSHIARLAILLTLAIHSLSLAQGIKYSVQEIPIYPGHYEHFEGSVNDNSVVVGHEATNGQAFQWKDGIVTRLPRFSPAYSYAFDINNSGVVVGEDGGRPVCWINGNEVFLGGSAPDPNIVRGSAECINSGGDIGGWRQAAAGQPWLPVIYSATTGSFRPLNFGGLNPVIYGINDDEDLVGEVTIGDYYRAFVYHNDNLTLLNTSGPEYITSGAFGINNFGEIVGYEATATSPNFSMRAVLWEIGDPNPHVLAENAYAHAINDSGTVVGVATSYSPQRAAIIADGQATDLNTLIPTYPYLTRAVDINNKGQILCHGGLGLTLLTPTPTITVRDAKNDAIPNVEFNLIRVTNDPPFFTEDTLGSFTTDGEGRLELTVIAQDTFSVDLNTGTKQLIVGDSLKISKHVHSMPAAKHEGVLGTMYSIHLDNAQFAGDGQMYFDTLKSSGLEVVLNCIGSAEVGHGWAFC